MRRLAPDVAIVAALAALFLILFHDFPSHRPYLYDEADYVSAAGKGSLANYLERPSMSIVRFLEIGMNRDMQANRASLSEMVRGARDITFYRHYHGPVYFYWLATIGPWVHFGEYALRTSGLFWHIAGFAVIYFGALLLSASRIAALTGGCLFLFGQANIDTDTQITPHIAYVFFTVFTLFACARYLQTGGVGAWYASVAAFAVAFCSVEYAILLPVAGAAALVLFPHRRPPPKVIARSAILFCCVLLALWPIGLLELSALKGYFSISYLALQRTGVYGDGTPIAVWLRHFSDSPIEYTVLGVGLSLLVFRRRPRYLAPFLAYAALMLLTTLKNRSLNSTYVSSILPCLAVPAGVAIASVLQFAKPVPRILATSAALVALALGAYSFVLRRNATAAYPPEEHIVAAIRDNRLESASVLVPSDFLPTVSYYFPAIQAHGYLKSDNYVTLRSKMRTYNASMIIGKDGKAAGFKIIHVDGNF